MIMIIIEVYLAYPCPFLIKILPLHVPRHSKVCYFAGLPSAHEDVPGSQVPVDYLKKTSQNYVNFPSGRNFCLLGDSLVKTIVIIFRLIILH